MNARALSKGEKTKTKLKKEKRTERGSERREKREREKERSDAQFSSKGSERVTRVRVKAYFLQPREKNEKENIKSRVKS